MANAADLAGIPLFASLGRDQLDELASWFHVQNSGDGVKLIGEGAPGYTFFVLAQGSAAVTTNGEQIASLEPGDFFGEVAILGDGHRTATVTSTSPVQLLVMFGTEFRRLETAHPEIAARIADAMQSRVARHVTKSA
jgi:CRP-like cAMP-binding protein